MKITREVVALVGILMLGMVGLVLGLAVFAKWSDGAIVGMVSGFGSVAAALLLAVRGQQRTADVLQRQDEKLDTVVAQTNGMSEIERQDIADRAAVSVVQAWKRGEI